MDNLKLQSRYAKSLFLLAQENNIVDKIYQDMETIRNVCLQNKEFNVVLTNPTIKPLKKKEILMAVFSNICQQLTLRFICLIVSKLRAIYLNNIALEYINLYKQYKNIKVVKLQVASHISEELRTNIVHKLETMLSSQIELNLTIKPELIGGLILQVDCKEYDSSFLTKINDLKKKL